MPTIFPTRFFLLLLLLLFFLLPSVYCLFTFLLIVVSAVLLLRTTVRQIEMISFNSPSITHSFIRSVMHSFAHSCCQTIQSIFYVKAFHCCCTYSQSILRQSICSVSQSVSQTRNLVSYSMSVNQLNQFP